ncbi:MAG TPA: Ig-like domain-containing protein, partial [Patescibacteria group bacterium]|nr:Ig-like domain-containing protein [Patescibacteria group bacterium]
AGSVVPSGNRATFTPSASLTAGLVYTANLTVDIKDFAGNPLAAPYSWSFTVAETQGTGIVSGSTADLDLTVSASPLRLPAEGGDVTFVYVVKNVGDVHITDIAVQGDLGAIPCAPTYVSGDLDSDGSLDPGAEWVYSCTTKVTKSGTHSAKATGIWNYGTGSSETASAIILVGEVTASANFHFHAAPYPTVLHPGGGTVSLAYHVGNLGETPISVVRFIGSPCRLTAPLEGDANGNGLIDKNEHWEYACEAQFSVTTPLEVYVIVKSGDVELMEVARLVVSVGVAAPRAGIHLHVQANPAQLPFGGGTTYLTYHVSNDGTLPLEDVTLVSGSETCENPEFKGGDLDGDRVLDLDERWTYECKENLTETEADAPVVKGRAGAEWASDDALFVIPVAKEAPPAEDRNATGAYDPATAASDTPDLDTSLGLAKAEGTTGCVAGIPYKLPDDGNPLTQEDTTVYYCGRDGMRHAFPNPKTYFSWYADFRNLLIVDRAALEAIPLGAPATYRPGARMLKIQSDAKVYAVARGGILRWIATEGLAAKLYGPAWNTKIDDLPEAFLPDYVVGEPVAE